MIGFTANASCSAIDSAYKVFSRETHFAYLKIPSLAILLFTIDKKLMKIYSINLPWADVFLNEFVAVALDSIKLPFVVTSIIYSTNTAADTVTKKAIRYL